MNYSDLLNQLYIESPYEGFSPASRPEKIEGWHSDNPVFKELIGELEPRLYIEVGSWLGASVIHAAEVAVSLDLPTTFLCVDTWLGSREFWRNIEVEKRYQDLEVSQGHPGIYFQFLANVMHRGLENSILPFPQTSETAALILQEKDIMADIIYIDGSHEPGDVYRDIDAYWKIIRKGGVLFGDDFDEFWPGLVKDVEDFANDYGVDLEVRDGFWIIRKPVEEIKIDGVASSQYQNRILRLESERSDLQKELETMTLRAGYFFEEAKDFKARLAERMNLPDDPNAAIQKLIDERTELEKTNGYYFEQLEGLKKANEQMVTRIKELQKSHVKLSSINEKLRSENARLQGS